MTNQEFSDLFDVLYNNIMSNQAPGLDEYEKSVFLTRAQDDILKAYFNPKLNKPQDGFDGSERRLIDFSKLISAKTYYTSSDADLSDYKEFNYDTYTAAEIKNGVLHYTKTENTAKLSITLNSALFDRRKNSASACLPDDIMMMLNEIIVVDRANRINNLNLLVIPLLYIEYTRLMSKPYKRPVQYLAWRISNMAEGSNVADLVVGPNDMIKQYVIRYVKRPQPIVLADLGDVSIDGTSDETSCELDPILHLEILQRAVELAKAAYQGDLNSQITLGLTSGTEKGIVARQS